MEISLKFGHDVMEVEIPGHNYMGTLKPGKTEKVADPIAEVKRALANPIASKRLRELVLPDDRVVILASDITRPAPSYLLIPPVIDELNEAGVTDEQIKVVFGLGVHRPHTEEEKMKLVGREVYDRVECLDHDPEDCVKVGVTRRGTPVEILRLVNEADFLICTGNLEFHYFAGFSGGAKALSPGVCSRESIKINHQLFLDPLARSGQIEGNPVREEIEEIGEMVGIDYIVNALLNSEKELVRVVAGDVTAAHREGVEYINNYFRQDIDELADIVVISPGGFPKDIDLYQTHKAMENASLAVKDGGIIIVAAECSDGLGEENFADAMIGGMSPEELVEELKLNFVLGRHKASRIANIHLRSQIYFLSDLPQAIKERLFLKNFNLLSEAIDKALQEKGPAARILIIPYGIPTLPNYTG